MWNEVILPLLIMMGVVIMIMAAFTLLLYKMGVRPFADTDPRAELLEMWGWIKENKADVITFFVYFGFIGFVSYLIANAGMPLVGGMYFLGCVTGWIGYAVFIEGPSNLRKEQKERDTTQ